MKMNALKKVRKWVKELIVVTTLLITLANQIDGLIDAIRAWFQ